MQLLHCGRLHGLKTVARNFSLLSIPTALCLIDSEMKVIIGKTKYLVGRSDSEEKEMLLSLIHSNR